MLNLEKIWDLPGIWELIRVVGKGSQAIDRLTRNDPAERLEASELKRRNALFAGHTLFHFQMSPFSARARRAVRELGLTIPQRDILDDPSAAAELISGGGMEQVPCLKIENPGLPTRWMYESKDIVRYLESAVAKKERP